MQRTCSAPVAHQACHNIPLQSGFMSPNEEKKKFFLNFSNAFFQLTVWLEASYIPILHKHKLKIGLPSNRWSIVWYQRWFSFKKKFVNHLILLITFLLFRSFKTFTPHSCTMLVAAFPGLIDHPILDWHISTRPRKGWNWDDSKDDFNQS